MTELGSNDDWKVVLTDLGGAVRNAQLQNWELSVVNRATGERQLLATEHNPSDALAWWYPSRPALVDDHAVVCRTASHSFDWVQSGSTRILIFARPGGERPDCHVMGRPIAMNPTHLVAHKRLGEKKVVVVERATWRVVAEIREPWYSPKITLLPDSIEIVAGPTSRAFSLDGTQLWTRGS